MTLPSYSRQTWEWISFIPLLSARAHLLGCQSIYYIILLLLYSRFSCNRRANAKLMPSVSSTQCDNLLSFLILTTEVFWSTLLIFLWPWGDLFLCVIVESTQLAKHLNTHKEFNSFFPHSADTTWQITAGCHRLAALADTELQVILVAACDDALLVTKYILNESGETWI